MKKHIDYLKDLIGIDHIALGSDFDGIEGNLEIKDASYLPLLLWDIPVPSSFPFKSFPINLPLLYSIRRRNIVYLFVLIL